MRASQSSQPPPTAIASPRSVAQGFADHLNTVLNRTVSDARLSLLSRPHLPMRFLITCLRDGRPAPMALHGTALRLYIEHEVDAVEGIAHTAGYTYTLQSGDSHDSWLVRWEYLRELPTGYPYALAHLHVNAEPRGAASARLPAKPMSRLHLPTARVALELVLRHVITEWNAKPKSPDWPEILDTSLTGFKQRRTAT